ncbi:MAG TPA: hypothetical protein VNT76_01200 [Candidatus Binatus sp.]|nr:hypothetical protein [Candidatus Binatus sp.]
MATDTVLITGNTYPVKEQIKALGGRWDSRAKGWNVPIDNADAARALVSAAPRSDRRYGSRYTRFSSGAEVYTNKRGRCEDAPCCGCCS